MALTHDEIAILRARARRQGYLGHADALLLLAEVECRRVFEGDRPVRVTVIEAHEDSDRGWSFDETAGIAWAR